MIECFNPTFRLALRDFIIT